MKDQGRERVALVTGAAGGIGRAVCRRLARAGWSVLASDLPGTSCEETLRDVQAAGREAVTLEQDVTSASDWKHVVEAARNRWGGLDALVNNAGIEGVVAPFEDSPEDAFDRVMAVNVKGVFLGIRACLPILRERGGGAIVNVASVAGLVGDPNIAPYIASKHAVLGLTRSAALTAAADSVTVNAVCPSPIETRMMRSLEKGMSDEAPDVIRASIAGSIPLGRYGTPDEVASMVAFLVGDEARFITGSIHTVDGGMTPH
ncbi:MAG: SDR family NAD(P)-dependent oxidoreductase [Myxococcota bacterium]|nr:SDR family NAD(P)-dependent oxidoreductase [Myxococcota bacterium]